MGTVKFNGGDFYLDGQYIGSGSGKMVDKTVNPKDARIEFLEEQLIHERARNEKLSSMLKEFKAYFDTPQELSYFIANASSKNAELRVAMEKLKQEAITIDMIEKAAYDIIRCFVKEEDASRRTPWATHCNDALVTLVTTRLVERVKQYAKD